MSGSFRPNFTAPLNTQVKPSKWQLERVLFALAGTMNLVGLILYIFASEWFLIIVALVGINQVVFATTGFCPASLVLRRAGLKGACK